MPEAASHAISASAAGPLSGESDQHNHVCPIKYPWARQQVTQFLSPGFSISCACARKQSLSSVSVGSLIAADALCAEIRPASTTMMGANVFTWNLLCSLA